jgi:hypothetical protein
MNLVEQQGDPVPSQGENGEEEEDTQVSVSIVDLCELTSIRKEDLLQTLDVRLPEFLNYPTHMEQVNCCILFSHTSHLQFYEINNYLRGEYVLTLTNEMIEAYQ